LYIKENLVKDIAISLFGPDYYYIESLNKNGNYNINEESIFTNHDYQNENETKTRIMNIIEYLRGTKSLYQNLVFVFEGADGEKMYYI